MIHYIVSIRDSAVKAYMRPFFVPSLGSAIRSFGDEVQRKDSDIAKHPTDYELYELGLFDDDDASVTMVDKPRLIARAIDYVEVVNESVKA